MWTAHASENLAARHTAAGPTSRGTPIVEVGGEHRGRPGWPGRLLGPCCTARTWLRLAAGLDSREPTLAGAQVTWPGGRRWAARSGTGRGRAGATRQGGSGRVWVWRWETHARQSDARWPPQLAGTAARTALLAIQLQ